MMLCYRQDGREEKTIERRTQENMKNYGMTLYDAFEEAAHKIPSAYDAKFLDFEKYPLKYKKEDKT